MSLNSSKSCHTTSHHMWLLQMFLLLVVILISQDNHRDVLTRLYSGVLLRSHSQYQRERCKQCCRWWYDRFFFYIQKMLVVISRQDSRWRNACPLKKKKKKKIVIAAGRKWLWTRLLASFIRCVTSSCCASSAPTENHINCNSASLSVIFFSFLLFY